MCYVELTNHFGKFLLQCIIIVAVLKNSNSGGLFPRISHGKRYS